LAEEIDECVLFFAEGVGVLGDLRVEFAFADWSQSPLR
jgi:hypothetical protein